MRSSEPQLPEPLLCVRGLKAYYGHIAALRGVDIDVADGEIVALIGANGAGKSTLMMTICGNPRARAGSIQFAGREITRLATHEIAALRIGQAPEGRRIFLRMTVLENLQLGAHIKKGGEIGGLVDKAFALFPRLAERRSQLAGSMSGGEQQMLAIARGLMAEPRLIILDEPSLGLMPIVTQEVFKLIEAVNKSGIGVLLVEQNLHQALRIAHRGYVLEKGSVVLAGTGKELLADDYVRRAFLGH